MFPVPRREIETHSANMHLHRLPGVCHHQRGLPFECQQVNPNLKGAVSVSYSSVCNDCVRGLLRTGVPLLVSVSSLLLAITANSAHADPWLEVGDRGLRSDMEILAARGLIDDVVTTWPIPKGQVLRGLSDQQRLDQQPEYVQQAAQRVLAHLYHNGEQSGIRPLADARFTNSADTIRDFGTLARNEVDARAGAGWSGDWASVRLLAGEQTRFNGHQAKFALDGSFASAVVDNFLLYGGMVDQWFGPGWTSSLILSNNARPFPKIGIMRYDPHQFESPWFSWLGPFQANFFVGVLNDPRVDKNTAYGTLRLDFSPVHGLEVALTRSALFCGSNHSCNPFVSAFHFNNGPNSPNNTADMATIEFKYSNTIGPVIASPYVQIMNRDTGPFTHAFASYLAGGSASGSLGEAGKRWRLTAEYADSVPTQNWFDFGKKEYGAAYNSYRYFADGIRYYDRALGFSLDSDSRLFSLAGSIIDQDGWTYRLVYYRANINSTPLANAALGGNSSVYDPTHARNPISAQPVRFNQVEAGLSLPYRGFSFELDLRAQDAKPFPKPGGLFSAELGIRYGF